MTENEEIFDTALQEMFGDRYQDDTKSNMARPKPQHSPSEDIMYFPDIEPVQADTEGTATDYFAVIAELTKTALPYGILNGLFYWWYLAELIDASVAVPFMSVFAALFGLGIGKVVGWKR